MIIYGLGYYNRRRAGTVRGVCRKCGWHGHLRTYTATQYFALYFIPVLPLSRFRVLEQCPRCDDAFGLPQGKFDKGLAQGRAVAVAAWRATPSDPQAALGLLQHCVDFHDRTTLAEAAEPIFQGLRTDAGVITRLAATCSYLGFDDLAQAAFLRAVELQPDEATVAAAERHAAHHKHPKPTPPNRLLQSLPTMIVPAVLLFIVGLAGRRALTPNLDEAYLVNGLQQRYEVLINGEPHLLLPGVAERTRALRAGDNRIEPVGGAAFPAATTVTLDVSWTERVFGTYTAVVNPDRAAILFEETLHYALRPEDRRPSDVTLLVGQCGYLIPDLDFRFQMPPEEVNVGGAGRAQRRMISAIPVEGPEHAAYVLTTFGSGDALATWLRARLDAGDSGDALTRLAAAHLPLEQCRAYAVARLDQRPVLVAWHRLYQASVAGTPEGAGLEGRYAALLAEDPADGALLYLRACSAERPEDGLSWLERAGRATPPHPYALRALAGLALAEGRSAVAVKAAGRRLDAPDADGEALAAFVIALFQDGDYGRAEEVLASVSRKLDSASFDVILQRAYALAKLGRGDAASSLVRAWIETLRRTEAFPDRDLRVHEAALTGVVALAQGSKAGFLQATREFAEDDIALAHALVAGRLDDAIRAHDNFGPQRLPTERLALYVILQRGERFESAARVLQRAVEDLRSIPSAQAWAGWLAGDVPPEPRDVTWWHLDPLAHPVGLVALAERFPARRDEYLALARRALAQETPLTVALNLARAP